MTELCDICDDETATHEELRQMRHDGEEKTFYVAVCDDCCENLPDCQD